MSFVRTNVANDQHVTASAYVACVYAYVASEVNLTKCWGTGVTCDGLDEPQDMLKVHGLIGGCDTPVFVA